MTTETKIDIPCTRCGGEAGADEWRGGERPPQAIIDDKPYCGDCNASLVAKEKLDKRGILLCRHCGMDCAERDVDGKVVRMKNGEIRPEKWGPNSSAYHPRCYKISQLAARGMEMAEAAEELQHRWNRRLKEDMAFSDAVRFVTAAVNEDIPRFYE